MLGSGCFGVCSINTLHLNISIIIGQNFKINVLTMFINFYQFLKNLTYYFLAKTFIVVKKNYSSIYINNTNYPHHFD